MAYPHSDPSAIILLIYLEWGNICSWGDMETVTAGETNLCQEREPKLNSTHTWLTPGFEPGLPLHPHVNCILLLNTYLHSCLQHEVGGRAKRKASEWREKREKAIIFSILTLYSPVCKVQQTFYVPATSAIISYMHARDFHNSNTF